MTKYTKNTPSHSRLETHNTSDGIEAIDRSLLADKVVLRKALRRATHTLSPDERKVVLAIINHPDVTNEELASLCGRNYKILFDRLESANHKLQQSYPLLMNILTGKQAQSIDTIDLPLLAPLVVLDKEISPNTLRDFGEEIVGGAGKYLGDVAAATKVHTASLHALAAGEWLPSDDILKRLVDYTGLDERAYERLKADRDRLLSLSKNKKLDLALGRLGVESKPDVFFGFSSLVSEETSDQSAKHGHGRASLRIIKDDHRNMQQATLNKLCDDLNLTSLQQEILHEVNSQRKPRTNFNLILEDFEEDGGKDIRELLKKLTQTWNYTEEQMADLFGISRSRYSEIVRTGRRDRLSKVFEKATLSLDLEEHGRVKLEGLLRGNTLADPENLLEAARSKLREIDDIHSAEAADLIRDTVRQIHHNSGVTGARLPKPAKRLIYEMRNEVVPCRNLKSRDEIADIYFPDDPIMARRFSNFMLGIADEETPSILLNKVREGEKSSGEMLETFRRLRRETVEEFLENFNHTCHKNLGRHMYEDMEKGIAPSDNFHSTPEKLKSLAEYSGLITGQDIADFGDILMGSIRFSHIRKSRATFARS